jgi:RNA polymerase sigma-70 factor (ECF subfamily)
MNPEPPEVEALRRAAAGDRKLLGEALLCHEKRLLAMVRLRLDRRLQRRVDAADVVQEAYMEALQRIDEYLADPAVPFFVWLRFITVQRLAAVHRHHLGTLARDARREISLYGAPTPLASSAVIADRLVGRRTSPTQAAMRAELKLRLEEVLNALPEIDREIVALRHFEHLTNSECAQVLGIQDRAAWARYARALGKLRKALGSPPGLGEEVST